MRHLRDNLIVVSNYIEGSFEHLCTKNCNHLFLTSSKTEIMDMSIHYRKSGLTGYKLGIKGNFLMGFAYSRPNINMTWNKTSSMLCSIFPLGELNY